MSTSFITVSEVIAVSTENGYYFIPDGKRGIKNETILFNGDILSFFWTTC